MTDGPAIATPDMSMAEIEGLRRRMISSLFSNVKLSFAEAIAQFEPLPMMGRVHKALGTIIHATVSNICVGEMVELINENDSTPLLAECVGFLDKMALLTPIGDTLGVSRQTMVRRTSRVQQVAVGPGLMGRVLNGLGEIIDGKDLPFEPKAYYDIYRDPPPALSRRLIEKPLPLGVRALDGLLTCGEGQRMGIFAASGVGKSMLLTMLAKGAAADVIVLGLIGERGREVREFIEVGLGPDAQKRCITVVATSDQSAMERLKAAFTATAIAEYFRDQGKRVLFMMDSVTRFARAIREIGLAAGEPPTRRGYPPSVFSTLPKLMERVGMSDRGSITALYTVLVEGDDMNEPIADEVRSILDGHIVLSQKLAVANHYPAIDILSSKSRVMPLVASQEHQEMAGRVVSWLAAYAEIELLLKVGEYQEGSDEEADEAIEKRREINEFLRQHYEELEDYDTVLKKLKRLAG
jgi:type III secretion protein N (ATPase)